MNLKPLLIIVAVIVLLPVAATLRPRPLTPEGVRAGFAARGMAVEDYRAMVPPQLDAVEHVTMRVDGARVNLYRFDNEGKIARNYEHQKGGGGGGALVQLGMQLGAAQPTSFTEAARKRRLLITVTSDDRELNRRVVQVFQAM